jgi:hypothetical protein
MEGWPRVDENSPERCGGSTGVGQCWNQRVEGSSYCPVHGGGHKLKQNKREKYEAWQLGQWNKQVRDHADSSSLHALQIGIGILCKTLELTVARCQTDQELVLKSGPISDLTCKLSKLITESQQMSMRLGQVMNRTEAMAMAQSIVTIIGEEVQDSVVLERIISRIEELMTHEATAGNETG